jgi:hypothetical protein
MRRKKTKKLYLEKWKRWTSKQIKFLRENYPDYTDKQLAEKLKKTLSATRHKIFRLDLVRNKHKKRTKTEIARFIRLYPHTPNPILAGKFGRTHATIRTYAKLLGLRKKYPVGTKGRLWSKKENHLLMKWYPTRTTDVIAGKLSRSIYAVINKAYKLGIIKKRPSLSKKQVGFVKKFYRKMTYEKIAQKFGTTKAVVANTAHKLKLKKPRGRTPWAATEIKFLRENYLNHTAGQLADKLKKSIKAIYNTALKLNLRKS